MAVAAVADFDKTVVAVAAIVHAVTKAGAAQEAAPAWALVREFDVEIVVERMTG